MRGVSTIDPLVGMRLDGYGIEARLASGGCGVIYRASHVATGREVAIKVLHGQREEHVARFRREAAVLVRLRNPHTISALEFGETADGTLYIVMELLRGES